MKFEELLKINVSEHIEDKNGLNYLSWVWAWSEFKKQCPEADYEILKFENNLPYVYDENTGYMVFTRATDGKEWKEMWLPVMDGNNKAMLNSEYTYKVKEYEDGKWTGNYTEKTVAPATMFDINKTIMRCLVKNIAMFGLGLYIYSGEDLPEGYEMSKEEAEQVKVNFGKYKGKTLKEIKEENANYLYWIMDAEYDYVKQSLKDACSLLVEPITVNKIELINKLDELIMKTECDREKLYETYNVESNNDMTEVQLKNAISILEKRVK